MFTFQPKYFWLTVVLFVLELYIGVYLNDWLIRPYGGDFLVVILLYCFIKTFLNLSALRIAIPVLLFAYLIEGTQYFALIYRLNLQDSLLAHLLIGSTFKWLDMLAYTLGVILVLLVEQDEEKKVVTTDAIS